MFATTALGLCALALMTMLDCWQQRKAKKKESGIMIPPGVRNVQIGIIITVAYTYSNYAYHIAGNFGDH